MLLCIRLAAQGEDVFEHPDRVPILGRIVTSDSLIPVRNTHIISKMAHCGTVSDRNGAFFITTKKVDTLWISCLGFARQLVPVDSTTMGRGLLRIRLERDTITLREVVIKPYYDYRTFKEMVINMPTVKPPREIERLNEELKDPWLRHKQLPGNGQPTISGSPLQYLYDKYNKSARRNAKLMRNRRMFNEILREQGRTDEILPDSLDYSVDYRYYEYEDEKNDSIK